MDVVWINFLYNPLLPIGILFSLLAVLAFLVALRGFLSGVLYIFTLNGNDDFNKAARIRVMWGFLLLIFLWSLWQVFVFIGAIVTGSPISPGFFMLLLAAVGGAKYLKKNVPGT
jgi:hypothetical protein